MPTIQGKIIKAFEPRSGQNEKGEWFTQDFLLESYDQPYSRKCLFNVWGKERLMQFNLKEGDDVAVDIDIDAREYNGRFYNSVRAWRATHIPAPQIQPTSDVGAPLPPPQEPPIGIATVAEEPQQLDPLGGGNATEDLPF